MGQPPLPFAYAVLYTDGLASLSSETAGWGVYTSLRVPHSNRICCDQLGGSFSLHHQHRGEISEIYHALKWFFWDFKERAPGTPRQVNRITDREYTVRRFGNNSIKARCNLPPLPRRTSASSNVNILAASTYWRLHTGSPWERHRGSTCSQRLFGLLRLALLPNPGYAMSQSHAPPIRPLWPFPAPKTSLYPASLGTPAAPPALRPSRRPNAYFRIS